jgi:hypothetical protein
MAWNFRGSLSRIELQHDTRMVLPFEGCAWLADRPGEDSAEPVLDARLELVPHDDIRIQAIREEAACTAEWCGAPAPNATGCIYRLESTVYLLVGVGAETMDTVKRNLLGPLAERRLHLNATIDFPGFAAENPIARLASTQPAGVARSAFESGRRPIYFDGCSLGFAATDWMAPAPANDLARFLPMAAGHYQPRL